MSTAASSSIEHALARPSRITDTHVHFWDRRHPQLRYTWLEKDAIHPTIADLASLQSVSYGPSDFIAESRFRNVAAVIHVQAATGTADAFHETAWLRGLTERTGLPSAFIAHVELSSPDVDDQLDRHESVPGFVGVRHLTQSDGLSSPSYERGLRSLGSRGLVALLGVDPATFKAAARLADRVPGTTLVIDHYGYPKSRDPEYFSRWRAGLAQIGERENTIVKLSGLGMTDTRWTPASIAPWLTAAVDIFGPERSVFGSNWPVDRLSSSYSDLIDGYSAALAFLSPEEQSAIWHATADRVFGIGK